MSENQRSGIKRVRKAEKAVYPGKIATVLLALLFTLTITLAFTSSGSLTGLVGRAAILSAKLSVPQGGAQVMADNLSAIVETFSSSKAAIASAAGVSQLSSSKASPSSPSSSSAVSSSSSSAPSSAVSATATSGLKPVKTVQMVKSTGTMYESLGDICVYNQTAHHTADIAAQLGIRPDVHINLKASPQVLIVHTHTSESFAESDTGSYDPNYPTRNIDKSKSIVRVGDEIEKYLKQSGIGVIHDTTYHDYPEYNGAYDKSLATIQSNLKKYPSIKVVLDIHRDSIQYSDGTRVKPTAVVNGKKAAQVMIVAPCNESETSLSIPDWQYNYRFGLRIQQQLVKSFPGFARPLNLCPRRYNMQVSHGSLLVEFGTEVNTLDEAIYAGQLFGQALSQVLLGLQG